LGLSVDSGTPRRQIGHGFQFGLRELVHIDSGRDEQVPVAAFGGLVAGIGNGFAETQDVLHAVFHAHVHFAVGAIQFGGTAGFVRVEAARLQILDAGLVLQKSRCRLSGRGPVPWASGTRRRFSNRRRRSSRLFSLSLSNS
jgi:hypothetical protein